MERNRRGNRRLTESGWTGDEGQMDRVVKRVSGSGKANGERMPE